MHHNIPHKHRWEVRVGINISNALYERVKPLKQTVNLSQVCREAIESYVEDYERAAARVETDALDEVIGRIGGEETSLSEVAWEELGWDDARFWVNGASREDFEHLFHRLDILKKQGRPSWLVPPPYVQGMQTFARRASEFHELFLREHERLLEFNQDGNPRADAEQKYMRAWVAYVTEVREKIRRHREERARDMLASRRTAPPEPEAPEHLL